MQTFRDKVAIVGMGCTQFGELWDKSADDLITDATYEACEDAGIEIKDVQAAWLGTVFSGHTALSLSSPLKLQYIPWSIFFYYLCFLGQETNYRV